MDGRHRLGDRYAIGDVLGRGGMAEVHEGQDLRLGRRVAVKILRPDLARDPSFQARFRREAQSAASLNHPNVVAVYDTGEDLLGEGPAAQRLPYIVMEYVDGMTLRQLLSSGRRLLPERAMEITAGVLAALDYSHRHGIVHRDIKPANVMLTRAGDVKVMDFGIARALSDAGQTMTAAQAVMGTAQYLSPEQARGEVVDARSDLYSTGCLLFELLVGRPPFTGDSPVSIAYQHVSEPAPAPSQLDASVPPEVDAVVARALAKGADDRYQSAAEFRADLERALEGGPGTAPVPSVVPDATRRLAPVPPAPAVEETAEEARRSPWMWVGVVAAVALVGVGVFLLGRALLGPSAQKVSVPSLINMTRPQATAALTNVGLQLGTQRPQTSDKAKDTIIAQDPVAGEQLEKGQKVNVTVSIGRGTTTVPPLVGLTSVDAARQALGDAGLVLGSSDEVDSDQPAGYVLTQSLSQGRSVDVGTTVDITVSNGLVRVPGVVGRTEAQAQALIAQAGFVANVVRQEDAGSAPGTVLSQAPDAGTRGRRGDTVTIVVATAPPTPTPTTETPTPTPTTETPTPTPTPTTESPTPTPTPSPTTGTPTPTTETPTSGPTTTAGGVTETPSETATPGP